MVYPCGWLKKLLGTLYVRSETHRKGWGRDLEGGCGCRPRSLEKGTQGVAGLDLVEGGVACFKRVWWWCDAESLV
jgi:hypothetical protein